jgi:hypothetical protein
MKRLFLLLLFLFPTSVFAQQAHPLPAYFTKAHEWVSITPATIGRMVLGPGLFAASPPPLAPFRVAQLLYTSSTGSDTANDCKTLGSPCNLSNGMANEMTRVTAANADILYLCAGACDGSGSATITRAAFTSGSGTWFFNTEETPIPNGTSFADALTIQPYPGESITIQPSGGDGAFELIDNTGLIIRGTGGTLIIDGINTTSNAHGQIELFSNYTRIQDLEVKNPFWSGISSNNGSGHGNKFYQEFINLNVHGSRCLGDTDCAPPHGMYFSGGVLNETPTHFLIDGGEWHDFHTSLTGNASGIECYTGPTGDGAKMAGIVIRNVKVYDNDYGGNIAQNCTGAVVYNALYYSNTNDGSSTCGIGCRTGLGISGGEVYNSVFFGNGNLGLFTYGTTVKNNIAYGNTQGNYGAFGGSSSTCSNNIGITAACLNDGSPPDPLFTNSGSADFSLTAPSPGIDTAVCLPSVVPVDILGVSRPQGGITKCDIGAYERTAPTSPNTRTTRVTDDFNGAAGALGGASYAQVGSGGITVNRSGSGTFTGSGTSADGSTQGIVRELTGTYTNKMFCSYTLKSTAATLAANALKYPGCSFTTSGGNGYFMQTGQSGDLAQQYTSIVKLTAGVNDGNVAYVPTSFTIDSAIGMEFNGDTGQFWGVDDNTGNVFMSPTDTTYCNSGCRPGIGISGDLLGDDAIFGDINFSAPNGTITVTGPGTGTVCISGSPCLISWTSSNLTGAIDCYYLVGTNQYLISSPNVADGTLSWIVNAPASATSKIRCSQGSVTNDGADFTVRGTRAFFR